MAAGHTQAQAQAQSESLVNRMDSSIFNLASLKRIDGDIEEVTGDRVRGGEMGRMQEGSNGSGQLKDLSLTYCAQCHHRHH